jgi:hypothetical protein
MAKYYTAFTLKFESDPNKIHCTHKYLDEQSESVIENIIEVTTQFFAYNGLERLPAATFEREEFFGPEDAKVRVLLHINQLIVARLYPGLKQYLDTFREDTYGSYRPHVTTPDLEFIHSEFDSYVLVRSGDGAIVKRWKI